MTHVRFPLSLSAVIATGFAIFSMFFGAGNILFPIELGSRVGAQVWHGYAGLFLSGVLFTLLGLIALILFDGKQSRFFGRLGKNTGFFLECIVIVMLGPLTGIPRAIDILYDLSLSHIMPMSLSTFIIAFLGINLLATYKRERVIPLLGYVISPLLVTLLFSVIGVALWQARAILPSTYSPVMAGIKGFRQGYGTMDLMAAFHFAPLAVMYLKRMAPRMGIKSVTRAALAASVVTGLLLGTIYAGLSFIGSCDYGLEKTSNPAALALSIATHILPDWMLLPLLILTTLAITSTTISLITIFSDFLREEVFQESVTHGQALWATVLLSGFAAHGGLHTILVLEKPFLIIFYPPLIVLALCNILYRAVGFKPIKIPVALAFAGSCIHYILQ